MEPFILVKAGIAFGGYAGIAKRLNRRGCRIIRTILYLLPFAAALAIAALFGADARPNLDLLVLLPLGAVMAALGAHAAHRDDGWLLLGIVAAFMGTTMLFHEFDYGRGVAAIELHY